MYQQPRRAKKLYFDVIPRATDDYLSSIYRYQTESDEKKFENSVWHIHNGNPPSIPNTGINFGMLLNLVGVANTEDINVLWNYLRQYKPDIAAENSPYLTPMLIGAIKYYQDKIKPTRIFRTPTNLEREILSELIEKLKLMSDANTAEEIQYEIYEIGKKHYPKTELVNWFKTIYETVLGTESGPRMGVFIKLIGIPTAIKLIDTALTTDRTKV